MSKAVSPLAQLAPGELEYLRKAIARKQVQTPLSKESLDSVGRGKMFARLGPLAGASEVVALALLDLALANGEATVAVIPKTAATLVWTGPEVNPSKARTTTAVLLELLGSAKERVLVVGYEFDHGAVIFGPLHKAMTERGVKASIYLDVRPAPSPRSNMGAYLAIQTHQFLKRNWPFGDPLPQLYHYPAGSAHGSRRSLHAKCVVVDGRHVLIGSANFTKRGHTRNLEVGVHLDDPGVAAALVQQFDHLRHKGDLALLPVAASLPLAAPPLAAEDEEEDDPVVAAAPGEGDALAAELLVSEAARPLFVRLVQRGVAVPTVGEDVEGDGGNVIGSPELSWDVARVAVLLPEQEASRKRLEAAGWTCFSVAMGPDDFAALCEAVGRGS